jgi:menaquinol-cytochrome c reductase iron-sulfur subunit
MLEADAGDSAGTPLASGGREQLSFQPRRSFLAVLLAAGTASVGAILVVPLLRFVLHPLLRVTTPVSWSDVGNINEFSAAAPVKKLITVEQRDGWRKIVSEKAVYVIRQADGHLCVLSSVCPHLGCSVAWRAETDEFLCPCHGGRFAPDGKLTGGAPPRGMDQLESKVEGGILKVHYQYFRQLVQDKEVIA